MQRRFWRLIVSAAALVVCLGGCTSLSDYVHNGFKVGPNYCPPPADVAPKWIDASDVRVRSQTDDLSAWWAVLNDPLLNDLVVAAYRQNLTLRQAGFQVLEARAQKGIAVGNFFPQTQDATGSYRRIGVGQNFFDQWNFGFNLAWELDFWGRFRRAIEAADDTVDASVFNYDDVLVTLLGDVASDYVQIRTDQERIRLLERLVKVQQDIYTFIDQRLKEGVRGVTDLDKRQAESDLKQSIAQITEVEIDLRRAENRLCTLLGIPAKNLAGMLDRAPKTSIPTTPDYVVAGVPADLLRRRPDVRRAERLAAAQGQQIGIAESDLYPAFTISGTLGWQAAHLGDLFKSQSLNANAGPSFQWNLLNYGRIANNIKLQDARFKELVTVYQNTVIQADAEVENGIVTFLQAQRCAKYLGESVDAAYRALFVIVQQYQAGAAGVDFNRYATILQNLVQQQDQWVQARGEVVQGLIEVYRALGGGWQIRLNAPVGPVHPDMASQIECAQPPEVVPKPAAEALPPPQPKARGEALELNPPATPAK